MSNIVQDLSSPALLRAIEANKAEEMATFGRYLPGAELHEDEEVQWLITGLQLPGFNAVQRTHFRPGDIDAKIDALVQRFKDRQVPMSWVVHPTAQPTNLATYLKAHGFIHVDDGTAMTADLQVLNEANSTPSGFTIEEIKDIETLNQWFPTILAGFGEGEEHTRIYYNTYINAGFGGELPWHHYIGRLNSKPVAVSSLLLHAGVAGIYGVATMPQARRQGIGAAMTLAPLYMARSLGYRIGILSPSEMGLGMYRRLGFQEYCRMSFYKLAE